MSITYEEALSTLQSMFMEPWTRDSLDAVLRHQKGHMENTVDLILRHGDKDPQALIDQLDAGVDPEQAAVALDEQLARQLAQQPRKKSSKHGKGTPTQLPDDFLRIPNYTPPAGSYSISDDEALARMLQDQLFTEELRRNPEFSHLARGGSQRNSATAASSSRRVRESATHSAGQPQIPNPFAGFAARFQQNNNNNSNSNQNIMKKLSEMGEETKRRLQVMAAQFNANANRANNNANTTSPVHPSERRGLLDDNDDMELAARKDL